MLLLFRSGTVVSCEPCELMILEREDFVEILGRHER